MSKMNEDKHEIAIRLYESTAKLYEFAFKTAIQLVAGYMAGSGLLFAFYVAHPIQRILLLLPAFAGVGLFILCMVAAWFTKNLDEMFSGPMETLKHAVNHQNFEYMFPAHEPLTALLVIFGLTALIVAAACLYIGDFYPKTLDPVVLVVISSFVSGVITFTITKFLRKTYIK